MIVRTKRFGFTVVELLTVVAIIAMLVALLIPSLSMVRNFAKETRQKAQFAAIGQALMAFRNDYGDYPPSEERDIINQIYCGAQKLTEALLGQDLLGFYRYSRWQAADFTGYPQTEPALTGSLEFRLGPYLDQGTTNAFRPLQLFDQGQNLWGLELHNQYVLCDCFPVKKATIGPVGPVGSRKTVKAGTPILYYRAYIERNDWGIAAEGNNNSRYDYRDNQALCSSFSLKNNQAHLLTQDRFYSENYKIVDSQVFDATAGKYWPHRPDSYILISAGADGLYGTPDDITNFEN